MSMHVEEFRLGLPMSKVDSLCKTAALNDGWKIVQQIDSKIFLKEKTPEFSGAAHIEVFLLPEGDATKITLNGTIFGYGHDHADYLKHKVTKFKHAVLGQINN